MRLTLECKTTEDPIWNSRHSPNLLVIILLQICKIVINVPSLWEISYFNVIFFLIDGPKIIYSVSLYILRNIQYLLLAAYLSCSWSFSNTSVSSDIISPVTKSALWNQYLKIIKVNSKMHLIILKPKWVLVIVIKLFCVIEHFNNNYTIQSLSTLTLRYARNVWTAGCFTFCWP